MIVEKRIEDVGQRLLDVRRVSRKVARSPRWVWSVTAAREFPQPIRVGLRGTRWIEQEIDGWIDALARGRKAVRS